MCFPKTKGPKWPSSQSHSIGFNINCIYELRLFVGDGSKPLTDRNVSYCTQTEIKSKFSYPRGFCFFSFFLSFEACSHKQMPYV